MLTDFTNVDVGLEGGNLYPNLLKQLGFFRVLVLQTWICCKPVSVTLACITVDPARKTRSLDVILVRSMQDDA
jgi:hypothetical protein